MSAEGQAASLLDHGYVEVEELGRFKAGGRCRHIGEQYPEARKGTGTIERIFHRPRRGNDIEIIVKMDDPDGMRGSHGYWADYHTVVVNSEGGAA